MNTQTLFFAVALSVSLAHAEETPVPVPELERLEETYQAELKKVTAPVTEKYREALERMKSKFTQDAELKKALAVEGKLTALDDWKLREILLRTPTWAFNLTGKRNTPVEQITSRVTFYSDGRAHILKPDTEDWTTWELQNKQLFIYSQKFQFDGLAEWIGLSEKRPVWLAMLPVDR